MHLGVIFVVAPAFAEEEELTDDDNGVEVSGGKLKR